MRIFVTGATGYIGRVVIERALASGHEVRGLSRSEKGDAVLQALGAVPVRGELTSLDVLEREGASADAVLHLAYIHDWAMDYEEVLRTDAAAVDALCARSYGSGKALVITSGTAVVAPDPQGGETSEDAPLSENFVLKDRIRSEQHALGLAKEGIRVSALRLPPYVYGRGGSYFAPILMQTAAKLGESLYEGEGNTRTSTVHVDDAADLYLLAAQKAKAGEAYNGTGSTSITLRALAETIGETLRLPVRSASRAELEEKWGKFLADFVLYENRASNRKAVEQLGWQPKGVDLLTDLRSGSYLGLAKELAG